MGWHNWFSKIIIGTNQKKKTFAKKNSCKFLIGKCV